MFLSLYDNNNKRLICGPWICEYMCLLFFILLCHKAIAARGSVVETKGYKKVEEEVRKGTKARAWVRKSTQERRDDRGQVSFL